MNRQPSLFVSHGAPTFALEPGAAGAALAALGRQLPRPAAVLVVSAHWMTPAVTVGSAARPDTIHDFGGFPAALYRLRYPAPGHPEFAHEAQLLLAAAGYGVSANPGRGLDHGAWVPLMHLFPAADVPVFQVSLPARLDADGAWRLGETLAPLAQRGVLILGSGSLTHNLYELRPPGSPPEPYAEEFAAWVREAVLSGDRDRLRHTLARAPHARRAHPSTEHFLPLLVAAGAAQAGAPATALGAEITYGVLSMESFVFGALPQTAPLTQPGAA